MAHDDDDVDFTALMRGQGVAPVDSRTARKPAVVRGERAAPREPGRATGGRAPVAAAAKQVADRAPVGAASKKPSVGQVVPAASKPASSPVVPAPKAELLASRAELRVQAQALERMTGERDELAAHVKQLEQERDAALRLLADSEQRAAAAARRPLAASPEVVRISLAEALVARGLVDPEEQARGLAILAGTESGPRLLATLETRDVAGLRSALERRLALLCGSCTAPAGAAVIEVAPGRCELCGGSEIQRAATRFIAACERAGVSRVRFVGGSPNYRTQLDALFPRRGPLTVRTTAGDKHVPLSRSKAQQRSDDLVVIWGATELDHATSGAYRAQFGRVEVIAHRGIGRMLDLAAERITTGGAA